jgi:hypothetical protein
LFLGGLAGAGRSGEIQGFRPSAFGRDGVVFSFIEAEVLLGARPVGWAFSGACFYCIDSGVTVLHLSIALFSSAYGDCGLDRRDGAEG